MLGRWGAAGAGCARPAAGAAAEASEPPVAPPPPARRRPRPAPAPAGPPLSAAQTRPAAARAQEWPCSVPAPFRGASSTGARALRWQLVGFDWRQHWAWCTWPPPERCARCRRPLPTGACVAAKPWLAARLGHHTSSAVHCISSSVGAAAALPNAGGSAARRGTHARRPLSLLPVAWPRVSSTARQEAPDESECVQLLRRDPKEQLGAGAAQCKASPNRLPPPAPARPTCACWKRHYLKDCGLPPRVSCLPLDCVAASCSAKRRACPLASGNSEPREQPHLQRLAHPPSEHQPSRSLWQLAPARAASSVSAARRRHLPPPDPARLMPR